MPPGEVGLWVSRHAGRAIENISAALVVLTDLRAE